MTATSSTNPRIGRLLQFLKSDPDNVSLLIDLADELLQGGDWAAAREALEQAWQYRPADPSIRLRRAQLELLSGNRQAAAELLESLAQEQVAPDGVAFCRAQMAFFDGAFEEVLRHLAGRTYPNAEAALMRARALHQLLRTTEALRCVDDALTTWPAEPRLLGLASLICLDQSDYAAARQYDKRLGTGEVSTPEALIARGMICLADKNIDQATRCFDNSLARSDADGRAWLGRGLTLMLGGHLGEACAALETAAKKLAGHAGVWLADGWCRLLMGRTGEAESAFRKALEIDRNFSEAHGSLAVALTIQHRHDEARDYLDRATGLDAGSLTGQLAAALQRGEIRDQATFGVVAKRVMQSASGPDGTSLLAFVRKRTA